MVGCSVGAGKGCRVLYSGAVSGWHPQHRRRPVHPGRTVGPARPPRSCRTGHNGEVRCPRRHPRIEEVAQKRLVEKFSDGTDTPTVVRTDDGLRLAVDGEDYVLTHDTAAELRDQLADALTRTHEFVHTTGTHREDGSYVVARRGADSAGHSKVFERVDALERLYDRLPDSFTAEDVGRTGLTGGRRHMLVWHFAEHPGFDCELVSRQPLTVEKHDEGGETSAADTHLAALSAD